MMRFQYQLLRFESSHMGRPTPSISERSLHYSDPERQLNVLGREGWEVVSVTPVEENGTLIARDILLKRPMGAP